MVKTKLRIEDIKMLDYLQDIINADEVIEREIKPFGNNTAHITKIDPKHIGKIAKIIIRKRDEFEGRQ